MPRAPISWSARGRKCKTIKSMMPATKAAAKYSTNPSYPSFMAPNESVEKVLFVKALIPCPGFYWRNRQRPYRTSCCVAWLLSVRVHCPSPTVASVWLCESRPVPVNLEQIVYDTLEDPLRVHLPSPPERKSVQPQGRADIGKDRFGRLKPSVVKKPPSNRIDLPLHLLREDLRRVRRLPAEKMYLPHLTPVRVSQALRSDFTCPAVCLASPKLDGRMPSDHDVAAVTIQAPARRTDAVRLLLAHREILGLEEFACSVVRRTIFPKPFLVAIHIRKPGVPFPELRVRHIAVDALFHEPLDIGLRVKAAVGRELRCGEDIARAADRFEVLPCPLDHRLQ